MLRIVVMVRFRGEGIALLMSDFRGARIYHERDIAFSWTGSFAQKKTRHHTFDLRITFRTALISGYRR